MADKAIYEGNYQPVTKGGWIIITILSLYTLGILSTSLFLEGSFSDFLYIVLLVFIQSLVIAGVFGTLAFVRKSSKVLVYSDRVEWNSVFLIKRYKRIEASKIESVDLNESLLGKHKYGAVAIRGSGSGALRISPVKHPASLVEEVRKIASSSLPKKVDSSEQTLNASLSELSQLFKDGVLSSEEFERAKKKLLD